MTIVNAVLLLYTYVYVRSTSVVLAYIKKNMYIYKYYYNNEIRFHSVFLLVFIYYFHLYTRVFMGCHIYIIYIIFCFFYFLMVFSFRCDFSIFFLSICPRMHGVGGVSQSLLPSAAKKGENLKLFPVSQARIRYLV